MKSQINASKTSLLKTLSAAFVAILVLVGAAACGGEHAADDTSHEHGPNTHIHDDPSTLADTAGTYVDTTAIDLDNHEHGPNTHTHDDDTPAHE